MSDNLLGKDIAFIYDFDMGAAGEGKLVTGRDCYAQDILHALTTPKGSLLWHPSYGVDILRFLKMPNNLTNRLALEQEIRLTVEDDPRTQLGTVRLNIREWDMNIIHIKVTATPITEEHPLNFVLGYGAFDIEGKVVAA